MELAAGVLLGVLVVLCFWWKSTSKKTPPGPWGLPLVGYLPFLSSKPYLTLEKLAKHYGNIFSIRLGSQYCIVLNDFQSTKDAFSQDAFIGRPAEFPFEMSKETLENKVFIGLPWKEQRRCCLHLLKDVGLGKSKQEEFIQEEIKELLEYFERNVNMPFCVRQRLAASMSNNIASIVFGKRLKYEDPVRKMLTDGTFASAAAAGQTGWMIFFPWIKKIMDVLGPKHPNHEMRNYSMKVINEHEKTLDPSNVRDFIDGYLLEIQRRKNDPTFIKPVLQDMVTAFFTAGSETVRLTVEWLLLKVASDKRSQSRIQAEIQDVTGQSRMPMWPDHLKMPFTDAFIMEVMRWRTLIPLNLIRRIACSILLDQVKKCRERCVVISLKDKMDIVDKHQSTISDTELNGYFIPKNTKILSNTWAIHHDPEYWGPDADEFKPERFLTDDGKEVKKMEHNTPFSIGKRSCPGYQLANVEVFLYLTAILQRFNLSMPDGKVADFEGELGVGLTAKPQEIVLTKRN